MYACNWGKFWTKDTKATKNPTTTLYEGQNRSVLHVHPVSHLGAQPTHAPLQLTRPGTPLLLTAKEQTSRSGRISKEPVACSCSHYCNRVPRPAWMSYLASDQFLLIGKAKNPS